jgi:sec-independent protein translocase protein TatB
MIFDIGPLEIVSLVVLGVILFGPDKLPKMISEVVRFIRKARELSDNATRDIRSELGPEFEKFELQDLNPRAFARRQLARHSDELGLTEIQELRHDITQETLPAARTTQAVDAIAPSDETRDLPWPP